MNVIVALLGALVRRVGLNVVVTAVTRPGYEPAAIITVLVALLGLALNRLYPDTVIPDDVLVLIVTVLFLGVRFFVTPNRKHRETVDEVQRLARYEIQCQRKAEERAPDVVNGQAQNTRRET